ncbi:MAG TPA: hypothetical protein PKO35_06285, partial [Candidatus Atribacteria bacterium]|nr:hypothetical protein [Candidatus Atribacteria bacterium]
RIISSHPVLKRLPVKYARLALKYIYARKTGIIIDNEDNTELGYIIDVPGFFMDWHKLSGTEKIRYVKGMARVLDDLNVFHICFPHVYEYFGYEEVSYLESRGFTILDCYLQRSSGLLLVLNQLLNIMKRDMPFLNTGIWGADTDEGRVWVEALADKVNNMCIGGSSLKALSILADRVLRTTGLSCQITTDARVCLNSKNIAVIARPTDAKYNLVKPSFHFAVARDYAFGGIPVTPDIGIYVVEMAWIDFPRELSAGVGLKPWEELGVLEGLIYNVSKVYREDLIKQRVSLGQLQRLNAIYGLYPLKVLGFVQKGCRIHFDRIRMDYFRIKRRWLNDNKNRGNNTP